MNARSQDAPCADAHFGLSERLNRQCACRTLDTGRLGAALRAALPPSVVAPMLSARPHLFADTVVFLDAAQRDRIAAIVQAVEDVIALPAYQAAALADASAIARLDPGPRGVFMGFDFHLGEAGPQLIEINTNAGGGLLNLLLARAQADCCRAMGELFSPAGDLDRLGDEFVAMFRAEWRRQRGDAPLRRIAIVDDDPAEQYLAPEFALFADLFNRHGIAAVVCDPRDLARDRDMLFQAGESIDLVYNRLTDFYLDEPAHAALREAYTAGHVALTPSPRAHALYANKRNLAWLSDPAMLAAWDVPADTRDVLLSGIPRTQRVTAATADAWWAARDDHFFKPAAGYGSKAAYRGDKLTRRVWQDIVRGDYVAQARVAPSQRRLAIDGVETDLKLDLRAYAYTGRVQLLAARLYAGQTTNFRTPGGGFASVLIGTA
ncbi:MAG: hypothetical protein AB7O21_01760 [Gammaproteobacteria bacterium]